MNKIFAIAKWEFSQRLKDKSFQISLIVIPIIILSINFAFHFFNQPPIETTSAIGVIDYTNRYFKHIDNEFKSLRLSDGQPKFIVVRMHEKTRRDLSDEKLIEALIIIEEKNSKVSAEIINKFTISPENVDIIKSKLHNVFIKTEINKKYDLNIFGERFNNYSITQRFTGDEDSNSGSYMMKFFSSFIFVLLLIVLVLFSGASFVRSLIEEKTTRLIELLLSSCKPKQILLGKLLGISLTGFFQMLVWAFIGIIFLSNNQLMLNLQNSLSLKLIYFILGYLLYASIFIGLGSIATSENQAQQISSILSLFLLFPIVLSTLILTSTESLLTKILIYFPLTASPTMLMKMNISETFTSDILISIILLVVSIMVVIILSSRFLSGELVNFEKSKRKTT